MADGDSDGRAALAEARVPASMGRPVTPMPPNRTGALLALLATVAVACTEPGSVPLGKGAIAPDIAGVDLDGVAFRLSDYQGKVVLLDFWGDW
jgi:hypothetical protein